MCVHSLSRLTPRARKSCGACMHTYTLFTQATQLAMQRIQHSVCCLNHSLKQCLMSAHALLTPHCHPPCQLIVCAFSLTHSVQFAASSNAVAADTDPTDKTETGKHNMVSSGCCGRLMSQAPAVQCCGLELSMLDSRRR